MLAQRQEYVTFEGMEPWWGDDIVSGERETPLVTVRGRDGDGEPMALTVRFEDFQRVVEVVQGPWPMDIEQAADLAAELILQQYAERPG